MQIYNAILYPLDPTGDINRTFCGWITFENGKITGIGEGIPKELEADAVDAAGAHLLPGLIDAHSHLGMIGDSLGFEGDDVNEDSDPVTPQMRAVDAINPFDRGFQEARESGVTTVVTGPGSANAIGGTLSAIKTAGVRVEDMLLSADFAMKFALGENPKSCYHQKSGGPETRMASAALIREALWKARRYREDLLDYEADPEENSAPEYDAKCAALLPVLERKTQAHFHAHRADDICTAIRIAKEFDLDYRLVHCTEGHLICDVLKEENAAAFLGPFFLSRSKPELAGENEQSPALLKKSEIPFSLVTDHPELPQQYLLLSACLAHKNGLDRMTALSAITCAPAKLLGLDGRVGSLKVGLDADLVLFDRDPFDFYARATRVWINGKSVK